MPLASSQYTLGARVTPEEVACTLRQLPSAPKVVPRLYRLLRDGDATLHEIAKLIRVDPGMTVQVLQRGNHLCAIKGEHCLTVEHAINVIGFDQIYALVCQVAVSHVLVRPLHVYGIEADEFWRWSVSCAISAELLAELTGEDTSVAYTVGLLHGVGMAAINEWASDRQVRWFASRGLPREYTEHERALLGFTQADVSGALLRLWDFPVRMIEPVRAQYAPRGSAGYARMACLLHAAKWLRSSVCADHESPPPPLPDPFLLEPLRLKVDRLSRLVVDVRVRLGEVRNLVESVAA